MTARYARQIILPEIGKEGQKKLKQSSVLCIGAGGLGSPALLYLAATGVGRIGIIDDDVVDITNLQRQVIFREIEQGQSKSEMARQALEGLNSDIKIENYNERFNADNAEELLNSYDLVIDGTDNFSSKFLINDACVKFNKPLVYGSILGFEAQVSVFWAVHGSCYRCLYPKPPSGYIPNCAEAGVIGAMAGIAGTVQALEAIKMLLGLKWCKDKGLEPLLGKLWVLDAKNMATRSLTIKRNLSCPVCSKDSNEIILIGDNNICLTSNKVIALSPAKALKILDDVVFIDVRERHELAFGIIPGAKHIPLGKLLSDPSSLGELQRNVRLVVYCQHGVRSLTGATHLLNNGFSDIAHLEGGVVRWQGKLDYLS